jgi:hypothetical protein
MVEGERDDRISKNKKKRRSPFVVRIERGQRGLHWRLDDATHHILGRGWLSTPDRSVVVALAKVITRMATGKNEDEIEIEVRDASSKR